MAKINSVLGPIDTSDLGFTLMHEHLAVLNWAMRQVFPNWIDRDEIIAIAVKDLQIAKEYDVETIVDATPINLGRDIQLIHEIAEKADINIIASTGFYFTEEPFLKYWTTERIVDLLLPEILEGIEGTDIKAGIIKCGTGELGITELNRKLLEVASCLQKETGLPITTHSIPANRNGMDQLDIFTEEDVNLSRVVIGHCDDAFDQEYLEELMERGCFIGFDRFGMRNFVAPDEERIDVLLKLLEMGYEDHIVISHDCSAHIDWLPKDMLKEMKASNVPNWRFYHFPMNVIPILRENNVKEKQIRMITVDNPKRIFE